MNSHLFSQFAYIVYHFAHLHFSPLFPLFFSGFHHFFTRLHKPGGESVNVGGGGLTSLFTRTDMAEMHEVLWRTTFALILEVFATVYNL